MVNNILELRLPGPWTPVIRDKTPPVQTTLFQWQIQQEEQKVAGMSAELLAMQDADGDTYVSSGGPIIRPNAKTWSHTRVHQLMSFSSLRLLVQSPKV